jgi:hypothetical protein
MPHNKRVQATGYPPAPDPRRSVFPIDNDCWLSPTASAAVEYASSMPDRQHVGKGQSMKKVESEVDEMRAEYDFSKGVRGKYAKQYAEGTNVVVLEPDIVREFPTAESVNEALRSLIPVITKHRKAVVR